MNESAALGDEGEADRVDPAEFPAQLEELLSSPAEDLGVAWCSLDEARRRELDRLEAATSQLWRAEVQQLEAVVALCALHGSRCPEEYGPLLEKFNPGGHDGTPEVSEYLCLEVAGVLGISPTAAAARIMRALDLVHRHPLLYTEVKRGRFRVWQAQQITAATGAAGLPLDEALWVDERLAPKVSGLTFGRVMRLVESLIMKAAPALARKRAAQRQEARRVRVCSDSGSGTALVEGRIDLADAAVLNTTVGLLAERMGERGDCDSLDVRRSKALGMLGTPARALLLLAESAGYADLVQMGVELPVAGLTAASATHTAASATHTAASATHRAPELQFSEKLLKALTPRTSLVVHCSATQTADLVGAEFASSSVPEPSSMPESTSADPGVARPSRLAGCVRIDGVGPMLTSGLVELLRGQQVVVRPVVDHNAAPAVDRYEIPESVRRAVINRTGHDAFPYGTRAASGCDLDHVSPYRWPPTQEPQPPEPQPPEPQTRVGNLTPLSRRAHRAKTDRRWRYVMTEDGYHFWVSPLGKHYLTGPHGTSRHDSALEARVQLWLLRSTTSSITTSPDESPPPPP